MSDEQPTGGERQWPPGLAPERSVEEVYELLAAVNRTQNTFATATMESLKALATIVARISAKLDERDADPPDVLGEGYAPSFEATAPPQYVIGVDPAAEIYDVGMQSVFRREWDWVAGRWVYIQQPE